MIFLPHPRLILKEEIPSSIPSPFVADFCRTPPSRWVSEPAGRPHSVRPQGPPRSLPSLPGRCWLPHRPGVATAECPWWTRVLLARTPPTRKVQRDTEVHALGAWKRLTWRAEPWVARTRALEGLPSTLQPDQNRSGGSAPLTAGEAPLAPALRAHGSLGPVLVS